MHSLSDKGTPVPDFGCTQREDILRELGECYMQVGDSESAKKCFDQAQYLASIGYDSLSEEEKNQRGVANAGRDI